MWRAFRFTSTQRTQRKSHILVRTAVRLPGFSRFNDLDAPARKPLFVSRPCLRDAESSDSFGLNALKALKDAARSHWGRRNRLPCFNWFNYLNAPVRMWVNPFRAD